MRWLLRIAGAVAAVVAVIVIALALAGDREGAGKKSASVDINRPAPQVFRHITQDKFVKHWVRGLVEMTPVSEAGLRVRDRLTLAVVDGGRRTEMQIIITSIEANRRLSFTVNSWGEPSTSFRERCEYLLTETDGHTHLRFSGAMDYFGPLSRLLEPLKTFAAQKKLEADLARLKEQVEAEPPDAVPASAAPQD